MTPQTTLDIEYLVIIFMRKFTKVIIFSAIITLLGTTASFAQTSSGEKTPLKIIIPAENQTIYGSQIPVLLSITDTDFKIGDFRSTPSPNSGIQGHVHLWLDEKNPTASNATKVIEDNFTYKDIPSGDHVLRAELVNNDHSSFNPPQVLTVNFKSAPAASPAPEAVTGFDKNTALVILVVVALVILAAWWYTKEEDETPPKSKVEKKSPKPKTKKTAKRKK